MFNPVRWFFSINKKCFRAIAKIFPNTKFSLDECYREQVKKYLADGCTVLDVGGGRKWQFQDERKNFTGLHVIALDPSEAQLSYNHDADEKILFAMGTNERAPLDDNSVDLVTSRMVLEHIPNNDFTMREISRILKPGGTFISVMPSKFALFAMINQTMPNWLARKVLFFFMPETKDSCGFKAYYDRTYYPAMNKLLTRYGFSRTEFAFSYSQSGYFGFFVPFAVISLLWDFLMYVFGVKPLSAYLCFTAHKEN